MSFDLNQFIQNGLIYGGARPSKFDVEMVVPTLLGGQTAAAQKLQFTCKAASIPAFTIGEVLIPYFGRKIKSAGDRTWTDWEITVMLDEDYLTRNLFEAWSNMINSLESNQMDGDGGNTVLPGESYKTSWQVNHYAKDETLIAAYTFIGCWPRVVGPIALDWDGTDRISQFNVTLAYDYLEPLNSVNQSSVNSSTVTPKGGTNITYTT